VHGLHVQSYEVVRFSRTIVRAEDYSSDVDEELQNTMILRWNREAPHAADCRGLYVAAVRDPRRGILAAYERCAAGVWRDVLREHCRMLGKEMRL
jgi:hypothetical protein